MLSFFVALFCQTRLLVGSPDHQLKVFSLSVSHYNKLGLDQTTTTIQQQHRQDETEPQAATVSPSSSSNSSFGIGSVVQHLGGVNRPHGRGRACQLIYAVDMDHFKKQAREAINDEDNNNNSEHQQIIARRPIIEDWEMSKSLQELTTRSGTLLTGLSAQLASRNSRQLVMLICPSTKAIEVYREFTPDEQVAKFKRRRKRAVEKMKKKQSRLEEVKQFCDALDSKMNQSLTKTGLGTTYEAEKDALSSQLEALTLEIEELQKHVQEVIPHVSDQFQYMTTFYLKQKPNTLDYCHFNQSLLISYGDNTLEIATFPFDHVLSLKVRVYGFL